MAEQLNDRSNRPTASPPPVDLGDVVATVKGYVRQETVGPLKGAGRWLAVGAMAASALGVGLVMMLIGLLRLLQTEWERSASGSLSWLAYVIVLVVCLALLAFTLSKIKKNTLSKDSH
ncbi:hypothetical protein BH20ACT4_BH20ACT4_08850 [soil metagenome]